MTTEGRGEQPSPEPQMNLAPVYAAFVKLQELKVSLDEVPDVGPKDGCIGCYIGKNVKQVVSYTYDYLTTSYGDPDGNTSIIISKGLPGYVCNNCNVESYNDGVYDRFQNVLADAFVSAGDNRFKQELEEREKDKTRTFRNVTVIGSGELSINPQT